VKTPQEATLIKVHPGENKGASEICKLNHEQVSLFFFFLSPSSANQGSLFMLL